MNKIEIQSLIERVIGKKGNLRTPAWWMRKLFNEVINWIQKVDDETKSLGENINYVENYNLPFIVLKGSGTVTVDGKSVHIDSSENIEVPYKETFSLKQRASALTFTYANFNHASLKNMRDLSSLLKDNNSLKKVSLSLLDTYSVTNMSYMFYGCRQLDSIDLSGFNTSSVTDMSYMFYDCISLASIDLSGFDTSSVTDMSYMFFGCRPLTFIDLLGFNTSLVTNMSHIFSGCGQLTSIDISSFDTSSVTNMSFMFSGCNKLTSLDLSGFDTSSAINMYRMFYNCSSLASLDLSSWNTSSVTNMSGMFYNCDNLSSLFLGPNFFKTSNVQSLDLTYCTKWVNETVQLSLVTNIYDRATNGLSAFTLNLSANTKAALSDEDKAYITSKGYTIA